MKVTLKEIKYAIAVSKHLNFRKASQECNISSSTLSNAIKNLENKINFEIFERNNKKVILTSLGKEFLKEAKNIIVQVKDLEKLGDSSLNSLSRNISIGIIPTIGAYLLPIVLPPLKHKYPKSNLKIVEAQSELLLKKLDSGEIILKKSFFLNSKENERTLKIKTQKLEYLAFPEALIKIYRYR